MYSLAIVLMLQNVFVCVHVLASVIPKPSWPHIVFQYKSVFLYGQVL